MNSRRLLSSTLLILLSFWLGWTVLVDFIVVPGVFRNIANFFEAGDLGIYLFQKLNSLELEVATFTIAILIFIFRKNRRALPLLISGVFLFAIAVTYFIYLTPKLQALTDMWKLSEAGQKIALTDIQQEHQYFHRIYVTIDSLKILILIFMMTTTVWKEEWTA
ncbi:MAG: DUF4149 domain-containing protein [Bdellovibrionota bacterium]